MSAAMATSLSPENQRRVPLITCVLEAFVPKDKQDAGSLSDYRKAAASLATLKEDRFIGELIMSAAKPGANDGLQARAALAIAEKISRLLPNYYTTESALKAASHCVGCIAYDIKGGLFDSDPENVKRVVEFLNYHTERGKEHATLLEAEYGRLEKKNQ